MTAEQQQHGRSNLLGRDDCVLVIIDAQEKLLPVISQKDRIIDNMVRLVSFSNIIGLPVVVTEQEKLGNTIPEIKKGLKDIKPVSKIHFNCFYNSEFADQINRLDRNTLVLAGVEAHICVAQTAVHALPRFNVHVIGDAVSSRTQENYLVSLERMKQYGATISSTEMFIYELLVKAGTDEFKSVLPLVK